MLVAIGLLAGCGSSTDTELLAVSPPSTMLLTCSSLQFSASDQSNQTPAVTWSAPAGSGTIDANGLYQAPLSTPSPATVEVTATSKDDPGVTSSAKVTLATAFPGAFAAIPGALGVTELGSSEGVYPHNVVQSGSRAYAVWPSNPTTGNTVSLQVARSDDGGKTWTPAVAAFTAALTNGQTGSDLQVECPSLAIDPQNPDVVYAVGRVGQGGSSITAEVDPDPTHPALVFAVSTDGAASFTHYVLHTDVPVGYCADVIAPAADAVVVEDPLDDCAVMNADLLVWSDSNRGAGFATGTYDSNLPGYRSDGLTGALDNLDGEDCAADTKLHVGQRGSTDLSGGVVESPELFTDGAGRLCLSYVGEQYLSTGDPDPIHAYVQCSDDLAHSFSPPLSLDPAVAGGLEHSHAEGAIGPDGATAVVWTRNDPSGDGELFLATSADQGRTFSAPVQLPLYAVPGDSSPPKAENASALYDDTGILWLVYRADDGTGINRVVVDKSCNGGETWSGAVLVNGTEEQVNSGTFENMKWPVLFGTSDTAPRLGAFADDQLGVFSLAP